MGSVGETPDFFELSSEGSKRNFIISNILGAANQA